MDSYTGIDWGASSNMNSNNSGDEQIYIDRLNRFKAQADSVLTSTNLAETQQRVNNFTMEIGLFNVSVSKSNLTSDKIRRIRELIFVIARETAVKLHNEKTLTPFSIAIENCLKKEFSDIPELKAKIDEDIASLSKQVAQVKQHGSRKKSKKAVSTFAAVVLILILVGAIASRNSDEKSSANSEMEDSQREISTLDNDADFESYTINVRHILVDDEATAEIVLADFAAGDQTEDSFANLAQEYSLDNADAGGLYENVPYGMMVDSFNDWCFDPAREQGDTGIIESPYGFHVMYFVGFGDTKDDNLVSDFAYDKGSDSDDKYTFISESAEEVEYSDMLDIGTRAYFDIVSIEPILGVGTSFNNSDTVAVYHHFACRCITPSGEQTWVYISTTAYKSDFDSSVNNDAFSFIKGYETVFFDAPSRVHGRVRNAEELCEGLSEDTGEKVLVYDKIDIAEQTQENEVEFSELVQVGSRAYADIDSILPVTGFEESGNLTTIGHDYKTIICACGTPGGEIVWVYLSTDDYKEIFDAEAKFDGVFIQAEPVFLSKTKRAHGIVRFMESYVMGLSEETEAERLLQLDSVE